ncbi:MAG: DUF45 domain-containing protein [Erysipelotrichaceae bacterium]|nr:DUF45 domain-containing protein [Erysipelotrichaceae bacterium]
MVEIKGIRFEVEINRKKIKNLYMRLKGNKLIVSAPLRMADHEIYRFIESKRDWIYKAYDTQVYKQRTGNLYRGGEIFYIYDRPYKLVRQTGKKNVFIKDDVIYLTYKDEGEEGIKYLYKYLDKYLLSQAQDYLHKHLPFLRDYGYNEVPELKCRQMSSKWGVCYTRKNRICISSYLIHYPLYCLEYIMVHEMVHFVVPNHSKRFYEVVANNMPAYKEAVKRLKQ